MIKIGKNISEFSVYSCQPKTRGELKEIIDNRIAKEGPYCDLNDIDTSLIDDMNYLFYKSEFNGDISRWNVSIIFISFKSSVAASYAILTGCLRGRFHTGNVSNLA